MTISGIIVTAIKTAEKQNIISFSFITIYTPIHCSDSKSDNTPLIQRGIIVMVIGTCVLCLRVQSPYRLAGILTSVKDFSRLIVKRVFWRPNLSVFDDLRLSHLHTFLAFLHIEYVVGGFLH